MTDPSTAPRNAYSPQLRTALVLTGSGTAGAYHAGVLRAFQEAGVKIDLVAGSGMGVASALFAAIDGGTGLWSADGLWRASGTSRYYRVRAAIRAGAWALALSLSVILLPLVALLVAGLVVYPLGFLLRLAGAASGNWLSRVVHLAASTRCSTPGSCHRCCLARSCCRWSLFAGTLGVLAIAVLIHGQREASRRGADLVADCRSAAVGLRRDAGGARRALAPGRRRGGRASARNRWSSAARIPSCCATTSGSPAFASCC